MNMPRTYEDNYKPIYCGILNHKVGCKCISDDSELNRFKAINVSLIEALEGLINNLPFGIEEANSITTHHISGGSGTMGPIMTKRLVLFIKQSRQALSLAKGEK